MDLDIDSLKQELKETNEDVPSIETEYVLARDSSRQTRPPSENFVAFAFNMAERIDEEEPSFFCKAFNCDEASQKIGATKEELESLYKIKLPNLLRNRLVKRLWNVSGYLRRKMKQDSK